MSDDVLGECKRLAPDFEIERITNNNAPVWRARGTVSGKPLEFSMLDAPGRDVRRMVLRAFKGAAASVEAEAAAIEEQRIAAEQDAADHGSEKSGQQGHE